MTIIHAQWIGQQALLPKEDFQRLLELARKSESIDVRALDEELTAQAMMQLAEGGGAFEFWNEPGEDIYSVENGEPI